MQKKMVMARITVLLTIALIVLGIYFIVHYQSTHKTLGQRSVPTVTVAEIKPQTYQPKIQATGYFTANQGITLKSEMSGRIIKINFESGQQVKQGDILVEFENSREKGALSYAKAQYELSKLTYQRNTDLEGTGAVSEEALDEAKASLDSDQGSMEQAQADYELTVIRAPFSGKMGLRKISIGDYLNAGDAIATLQSLNPMYIDFYIAEKYLSQIKAGKIIELQANTQPDKITQGTVKDYESVIDSNTGMIEVRASVENSHGDFLPGGYAEVTLFAGDEESILAVPQTAIVYDTAGNYVYVVRKQIKKNNEDNKNSGNTENQTAEKYTVEKQIIKLGDQVGQDLSVTEGLSFGDIVVVAGTNKIHNGSEIVPVKQAERNA